jgi:CsoR family transcriptional regulator, copper-sensing transcriptional repressor
VAERPDESKRDVLQRLKRIEGQARGLQKMIEEGRECEDVVIQLAAIKSAIDRVSLSIVGTHMIECITTEMKESGDCQKVVEKMKDMFMKLS